MGYLVTEVAQYAAAILAVITLLMVVSRLRPARWLWRTLIADPTGKWLSEVITDGARAWHTAAVEPRLAAIEKQLVRNDGSTLRDVAEAAARDAAAAKRLAERIAADRGLPPVGMDPTAR